MRTEILQLRMLLFALYVLYPAVVLRGQFLTAFLRPFSGLGGFLLVTGVLAGVTLALTLNHIFGILAIVCIVSSDLASGMPLLLFIPHVVVTLAFAEGTVALRPYQIVANMAVSGNRENVTAQLRICLSSLKRKLMSIFGTLLAVATGYGLLLALAPANAGVVGLAVYGAIVMLVFGIIALYLGSAEQEISGTFH